MNIHEKIRMTLGSFRPLHLLGVLLLVLIFIISFFVSLEKIYEKTLIEIPAYGGSVTEAIVGVPRFVNPILAESPVDRDIVAVVYSGLMKHDIDGTLVPDLAESYAVSEDGLTYTFVLKDGATFHDDSPVTADDVIYTILLVQDRAIKSPRYIEWEGVNVEKIDDLTIKFTLKKEYDDFLEKATLGILPKAIWKDLSAQTLPLSDYNQNPVGSGPYEITGVKKSKGVPEEYTLHAFSNYAGGRAYIDTLIVKLFPTEDAVLEALENGDVESVARLDPINAGKYRGSVRFETIDKKMPRVYSLFINQTKNTALVDKETIAALNKAIDKKRIVTESLIGFGQIACSPIPPTLYEKVCQDEYNPEEAASILQKNGYVKNEAGYLSKNGTELAIHITSINNSEEIKKATEIIRQNFEAIGVRTFAIYADISDINQRIIKERDYEMLLYGTDVKNGSDLYAFWHSSQRIHPGLNLSQYTNSKADDSLEQIRKKSDPEERAKLYANLDTYTASDVPAIFLFSPSMTYIYDKHIHITTMENISDASRRLDRITDWYIYTEEVWGFIENTEWLKSIRNKIY